MKRLYTAAAFVLLSGSFALAQNLPAASTSGAANPSTLTPSGSATVGKSQNVNPNNSQDMSNRSNPQDLTKPGANNPQDLSRPTK